MQLKIKKNNEQIIDKYKKKFVLVSGKKKKRLKLKDAAFWFYIKINLDV